MRKQSDISAEAPSARARGHGGGGAGRGEQVGGWCGGWEGGGEEVRGEGVGGKGERGNITCTIESSPKRHVKRVGVSALRPESVTSSTVSPMERTKVALTKETTMYASCSSERRFLTVHTAFGLPGEGRVAGGR